MSESGRKQQLRPWSAANYLIEVVGRAPASLADYFAGSVLSSPVREHGWPVTTLSVRVKDQSELVGLLIALADNHLPILSIRAISEDGDE